MEFAIPMVNVFAMKITMKMTVVGFVMKKLVAMVTENVIATQNLVNVT